MRTQFGRTGDVTPSFLVLGEIRHVAKARKRVLAHLRHHPTPVFMFSSLAHAVATRYPIAEAQLV